MTANIDTILDNFFERLMATTNQGNSLLIEYDDQWLSPCVKGEHRNGDLVPWEPSVQQRPLNFDNLARALEIKIPSQFETLFTRYWSDHVTVRSDEGELTLLQVWNSDDFERLQQNLIGHVLMKRRLKQDDTLFFAITDQEDYIVSIECVTGFVVVERVGKAPHKKLANSIGEFLEQLVPSNAS